MTRPRRPIDGVVRLMTAAELGGRCARIVLRGLWADGATKRGGRSADDRLTLANYVMEYFRARKNPVRSK